jgi:epoxyqueuosine reductase
MSGLQDTQLRERLRACFLDQGFTRVGFTSADPVADGATPWVAAGRHASMEWMTRDPAGRADPRRLLAEVRGVICVGVHYPAGDGRGAVAAYAQGEDYHRTMRAALERAVARMEQLAPGVRSRICVDTAPLLERSFAARAGLGWIGRNTLLLDETHGPWMLLGEVLTDLELPADEPAPDRCGSCTACVDACPTGALDTEYQLDAGRCLSYWTIEHRGPLPDLWGQALGHRAFGCDDCLTACPFPRQELALTEAGPFEPRPDLRDISLAELRSRAEQSFRAHFGSTPLERARKGGLMRNLGWCEGDHPATDSSEGLDCPARSTPKPTTRRAPPARPPTDQDAGTP